MLKQSPLRRRDYDKDISKLLDDIPRATSAPPHLAERWAGVSTFAAWCLPSPMRDPIQTLAFWPPCRQTLMPRTVNAGLLLSMLTSGLTRITPASLRPLEHKGTSRHL